MFSKDIKEILKEAGWYEGRKIDVSEQIDRLKCFGFEIFDIAPSFLEEFDKLRIMELDEYINYNPEIRRCRNYFNVMKELKPLDEVEHEIEIAVKNWFDLSKETSEKTIPIGGLSDGEMTLFLTETGKIVTDCTIKGNSIEEGVINVISNKSCGLWHPRSESLSPGLLEYLNSLKKL